MALLVFARSFTRDVKKYIDATHAYAHRDIDTAALPSARAADIERLARRLAASSSAADAFSYDVTIDGETFSGVDAEALVEAMTR